LRGVGSVVDIFPSADFRKFIPVQTANERMSGHWKRVGNSLQRAITTYQHEQIVKKQSS